MADETTPIEIEVPTQGSVKERLTSRKFLLSVAAAFVALTQGKPEWAVVSAAVYTLVEGFVDLKRA